MLCYLLNILNKGSGPSHQIMFLPLPHTMIVFPTIYNVFSPILEQCTISYVCGLGSPSFQPSNILYFDIWYIPARIGDARAGIIFWCKRDTWYTFSEHILKPPKYLIVIVDRFNHTDDQFITDMCLVSLDRNIRQGLYKFSLQATIDHHGWTFCMLWSLY